MEAQYILDELDLLFAKQDIQAVEPYLTKQLERAYAEKDYDTCITIMNELIGFFRDTSQYQKSLDYCEQVLKLMQQLGYEGSLPYGTTALNVANALRAAGRHKQSLEFYERVFPIYREHLDAKDERFASLYNNLSLLYQEMNDFETAVRYLEQALEIVSCGDDIIKVAITHSNLGSSLLQLGDTKQAMEHLEIALSIYNRFEEKDFHYNAAVAAMGQAYVLQGKLKDARDCFLEALYEQKKHCGKSEAFYRILGNLNMVEKTMGVPLTTEENISETVKNAQIRGLDLAEEFYESVAKKSLFEAFEAYVSRMAIGLVGEGSDCFGFDDAFSTDHDFGPGFCIWLNRDDYEVIGKDLQDWYDNLPTTYRGFEREVINGAGRARVWCIDDFFEAHTGFKDVSEITNENLFLMIPDEGMSCILNGRIFHDPSEEFSRRRVAFYDAFTEKAWNIKIATSLIHLGKYGQYNYSRCMKRGDYVTAQMVLYKYIEELLKFVHYMNHVFPPYYKWLKKSASGLEKLAVFADLTNALADFADGREAWKEDATGVTDKVVSTIEIIAKLIVEECKSCGLFDGLTLSPEELFLESYGKALYAKIIANNHEAALENKSKEELVDCIVSLEWQAFDNVQNQGGRAECQDDWGTFSIMRKSQYLTWPKALLISYIKDFRGANAKGWNLITEKYGRMMKTTDPSSYVEICDKLLALTPAQESIIEQIVEIQVSWMEEFAVEYPHMAANSRSIHTEEDTLLNTSYETYLRGELSTYSPDTLKRYGDFVVNLARTGENLAKIIMTNTALLYGYDSLEHAEESLKYEK